MDFLDINTLAKRIEKGEANIHKLFTELHRSTVAGSQAQYQEIGSGVAAYISPLSPLTQAFGLGFELKIEEIPSLVAEVNDFYIKCQATAAIELSHTTPVAIATELIRQGYLLTEYSAVLIKAITATLPPMPHTNDFDIQPVAATQITEVAQVVSIGFGIEEPNFLAELIQFFELSTKIPDAYPFCATVNETIVGGGNLFLYEDIAFLAGASVLTAYRGRGIQTALIAKRLQYAAQNGARWAVVATEPGSISQKNFLRQGFQTSYARNKFTRPLPATI